MTPYIFFAVLSLMAATGALLIGDEALAIAFLAFGAALTAHARINDWRDDE